MDGVRRPSAGLRRRRRVPFLPQCQLPQPLRQGAPRRDGDMPSSGSRGGGRPSRHRGGAAAGAGADPQGGRLDGKRLRAERGGTARRGPAPGAPAHEGDRRRGRAVVQRAERQAIEERDPPFMPGGRPGGHGPLPAGPGPANPDRHGRGATGRPAPSRGPGETTACRPTTRTSTSR